MNAYLSEDTDDFVTICADDNAGRRSRASQISALKRKYEAEKSCWLMLIYRSYSETPGFMSRSSFRYRRETA